MILFYLFFITLCIQCNKSPGKISNVVAVANLPQSGKIAISCKAEQSEDHWERGATFGMNEASQI